MLIVTCWLLVGVLLVVCCCWVCVVCWLSFLVDCCCWMVGLCCSLVVARRLNYSVCGVRLLFAVCLSRGMTCSVFVVCYLMLFIWSLIVDSCVFWCD